MKIREEALVDLGTLLLRKIQLGSWEEQLVTLEEDLEQLQIELTLRESEASRWKEPNFLLRLVDPSGKKQDAALTRMREAKSNVSSVKWELEQLQQRMAEAREEAALLHPVQEQMSSLLPLQEAEYGSFLPAALEAVNWCIDSLTAARPYVRRDTNSKRIGVESRRMELLAQTQIAGQYLHDLLQLMPALSLSIPAGLQNPEPYIRAVTSPYGQLDRLNGILEDLYPLRTRLKEWS